MGVVFYGVLMGNPWVCLVYFRDSCWGCFGVFRCPFRTGVGMQKIRDLVGDFPRIRTIEY